MRKQNERKERERKKKMELKKKIRYMEIKIRVCFKCEILGTQLAKQILVISLREKEAHFTLHTICFKTF